MERRFKFYLYEGDIIFSIFQLPKNLLIHEKHQKLV